MCRSSSTASTVICARKGRLQTLACGYGGSSGALISMGALQMGLHEEELPEIIDSWREANPKIVQYWWDMEKAAMHASTRPGSARRSARSPSSSTPARSGWCFHLAEELAYLKPRLQPNRFGRMSLTYEGVGQNHKWSQTGNLLRPAGRERNAGDCP